MDQSAAAYGKHQTVLSIETLTEQSSRGTGSTSELVISQINFFCFNLQIFLLKQKPCEKKHMQEETKFEVDHPDHCLQEWGPLTMLIKTGRGE